MLSCPDTVRPPETTCDPSTPSAGRRRSGRRRRRHPGCCRRALTTTARAGVGRAARSRDPRQRRPSVIVHRGGPDATIRFHRAAAGEVFLEVTVSARGVSWADRGNESAVVSAYVDGHYATDIVITSAGPVTRQFALGSAASRRTHAAAALRRPAVRRARPASRKLQDIGFSTVRPSDPAYAAARYAPVLYGRNVAGLGGRFQNNRTDTPLVAWHQVLPAATPGHSVIEYSVVWSNEDGGTGTVRGADGAVGTHHRHRVGLPRRGRRPGTPGAGHRRVPEPEPRDARRSTVAYDGTHPLLQTCTSNNNVCDAKALKAQHQVTTRCGSRSPPATCSAPPSHASTRWTSTPGPTR